MARKRTGLRNRVWSGIISLSILSLMGIAACPPADVDGDGFDSTVDCNDTNANTYPGAPELCDEADNDCDGVKDEGVKLAWFEDQDGDGFGVEETWTDACAAPAVSWVNWRGDCDDTNKTVHPGADEEGLSDDIDNDCGGSDKNDPHVGLSYASADSLMAALYESAHSGIEGTIIWVGPGVYIEDSLKINDVTLISTNLADDTIIDGQYAPAPIMYMNSSVLDGFTVQNGGESEIGATIVIQSGPAEIQNCVVTGNVTNGTTIYAAADEVIIRKSRIENNDVGYGGGGVTVAGSAKIENSIIADNTAGNYGGGVRLIFGSLEMVNSTLVGNSADVGGVIYVEADGVLTLNSTIAAFNTLSAGEVALFAEEGAEINVSYSDLFEESGTGTVHNLSNDQLGQGVLNAAPLFGFADVHLSPESPCVDSGDPASTDADGSRADMGSYGGPNGAW